MFKFTRFLINIFYRYNIEILNTIINKYYYFENLIVYGNDNLRNSKMFKVSTIYFLKKNENPQLIFDTSLFLEYPL